MTPFNNILILFQNKKFAWRAKNDEAVKSQKSDGTVKSFRCQARKSDGMRRTYLYAAMTEDAAPVFVHRTEATPQMARFSSLSPAVRRDFLRSRQK
jgi:hypothetical protein